MQFSTFDLIEISLQEVQTEFPMSKKGCKSFYNKDGVFIPKKFVKKMCEKLCLQTDTPRITITNPEQLIDQGKGQNYIYILNNNNFVMTYDFYVLLKFIT